MTFAEKIKKERKKLQMTQADFAKHIGVSYRMLQNYELGKNHPRTRDVYQKIATALNVDVNYLLTEDEDFVLRIGEEYSPRGKKGAERVLADVNALFAGGEMADEDIDTFMQAVQQAYWEVKKINKEKYTPKKYRKEDNE